MKKLLTFLRRDIGHPPLTVLEPADEDLTADFTRIRCPLCDWRPRALDRWRCDNPGAPEYFAGGCGTVWNTFQTRGRCPGCSHQWRWTTCHACGEWSLHEDWYERDDSDAGMSRK